MTPNSEGSRSKMTPNSEGGRSKMTPNSEGGYRPKDRRRNKGLDLHLGLCYGPAIDR